MKFNYRAESKVAQASFSLKQPSLNNYSVTFHSYGSNEQHIMQHKNYYLGALVLVVLDQLSKQLISTTFSLGESIDVASFLSWTYLHNSGAAFSFLANSGGFERYLLLAVSIVASIALIIWMLKTNSFYRQRLVGQSVLLSGALGNLIDRALYGSVIDFINLHYATFYFPVFNLADSFIFIGVVLLLFEGRQEKPQGER